MSERPLADTILEDAWRAGYRAAQDGEPSPFGDSPAAHPADSAEALLRHACEQIKQDGGKVCPEYEVCNHAACESSYFAWAAADQALRRVAALQASAPSPAAEPDLTDFFRGVVAGIQSVKDADKEDANRYRTAAEPGAAFALEQARIYGASPATIERLGRAAAEGSEPLTRAERKVLVLSGYFPWGGDAWIHEDDEGTVMSGRDALAAAYASQTSDRRHAIEAERQRQVDSDEPEPGRAGGSMAMD